MNSPIDRRQFLAITGAPALAAPVPAEVSHSEFSGVPASTRLRMHWWVFGTAWTKQEAERQLDLMNNAHIGSVLIFPAHPYALDDPSQGIHNQQFLSAEFFDVLNSVVRKARELNFTLDIVAGTGWPYGGPMVTADLAARMVQRARIPAASSAPIKLPALQTGQRLIAVFHVWPGGFTDIGNTLSSENTVRLDSTGAGNEIQMFYSAPTGQQVKRASAGAEGHVLDHFNADAIRQYMNVVGRKLLDGVPKNSFRSFFCDSFEVYRANWTHRFPEMFRGKHGYDLVAHLPALFDDAHPDVRDLRHDLWRTLSELSAEQFVRPLQEWSHQHGIQTQVEAYGAPPISFAGYQHIDIPCGEGFQWKMFNPSRWASSGGRLAGKRMIATEGWTWLGFPNRFGDSMERLKVASDIQFLSGINETYGVTYAYSPVSLGAPGWPPYFGPIVNHTQPYWPHFSYLADYIARTQFMLQQGRPVTDVALYLAEEDCFAGAEVGQLVFRFNQQMSTSGRDSSDRFRSALDHGADVIATIVNNGYSFDGVDGSIFRAGLRGEDGRLRLGDGDYSILVLPNLQSIALDVLEKIARFAESGGVVIATKRLPETCYGLANRDDNRQRLRALLQSMFGFSGRKSALVSKVFGRGKVVFCPDEQASFLAALNAGIQPDIQFEEPSRYVGFQHRRTTDRDFYFVVNTAETRQDLDAIFRIGKKHPELWDPRTGAVSKPVKAQHVNQGTRVQLQLESYESKFIVFSDSPGSAPTEKLRVYENGDGGVRGLPAPLLLQPKWNLRFGDQPGSEISLDRLQSWTVLPHFRYFSGSGRYEAEFTLPREFAGFEMFLDLGRVHETAAVEMNGKSASILWMRPYRVQATGLLHPGTNHLRITVTNLLINKVLGDGPIDYANLIAKYGDRFPAGDEWELVREPFPSGLLGPVRLVFFKTIAAPGSGGTYRPLRELVLP